MLVCVMAGLFYIPSQVRASSPSMSSTPFVFLMANCRSFASSLCLCMPWCACGSERTACGSRSSPSTLLREGLLFLLRFGLPPSWPVCLCGILLCALSFSGRSPGISDAHCLTGVFNVGFWD